MKSKKKYIILASIAGLIACIGDFAALYIFAAFYPGYNQLTDTMSALGASVSPVSNGISIWWIMLGLLFIFFGTGVKKAFAENEKYSTIASWLIILYGLGEGIGSGVFKADHLANGLATTAIIHNIVGGMGVFTILALPLVMPNLITKTDTPGFHRMSKIIFIAGMVTLLLFMFRFVPSADEFIASNKGLWQRLFVLNSYIYLVTIAVIMIKKQINFSDL